MLRLLMIKHRFVIICDFYLILAKPRGFTRVYCLTLRVEASLKKVTLYMISYLPLKVTLKSVQPFPRLPITMTDTPFYIFTFQYAIL